MSTATGIPALPDILREHEEELTSALAMPVLATWDKDQPYRHAPQPEAIGKVLVDGIHADIGGARIGYLFREKMQKRERVVLATASKVGTKLAFFADLDFLVEVNWTAWRQLSPRQRVALIDHELCHFGIAEDEDGEFEGWALVSHDLEEFGSIVTRWGLWKGDVAAFYRIMIEQGDLFLGSPEA